MNNRELYQKTFSKVCSSSVILWEDMENQSRKKPGRKLLTLVIAAVLVIGLSAAALAGEWFGLREMELREEILIKEQNGEETVVSRPSGVIGLQGFYDSPELQAVKEWKTFLVNYDDGGVLERLGNSPSGFEEEYGLYRVYTQEMADNLDAIVEKYGLRLHTDMIDGLVSNEALYAQIGGDFLRENRAYSAYMYEDGTFKFDGEIELESCGTLDYQLMRCVRGSFTDAVLYVGNTADYREWTYTTACGIPVTLALGPSKGLILADLQDCFVTVHTLVGSEMTNGALQPEDLQRFADTLDFSLLSPVQKPVPVEVEKQPGDLEPEEDLFLRNTGVREAAAQQFYAEFSAYVENGERLEVLDMLNYPAVLTGEGETISVTCPEELLLYYDHLFSESLWEQIMINQYTKEWADLFYNNGMIGAAGGAVWLAPTEKGLCIVTVQNPVGWSLHPVGESGINKG